MTKKQNKIQTQKANPIMDKLLNNKKTVPVRRNSEVDTTIISISKKGVLFNLGAKAYAVLGEKELKDISTYLPYLKPNDTVRVRVISEESKEGYPVVSMQRFFDRGKWKILEDKRESEEDIEVLCGEFGKGGVFVDFMGIRGVIPKIQLTQDFIDGPSKLENQKVKVKVLEVDEIKNRLVVSQKAAFFNTSQKELKERFDAVEIGKAYKAKVLGASEFGIFCEVEGVEGLVHISEISWEKVTDASSFVHPGDMIDVLVVEKNIEDMKLNLSVKRLSRDPWDTIDDKYPKEKEIEGHIVRREPYGYFVRLEAGIEGLIHISKLKGDENFPSGAVVKVFVERVNRRDRKMSLVLPQKEKPLFYR